MNTMIQMFHLAARTLLSAVVLTYILPMVGGFHFHGEFLPWGLVYGLLLAVVSWLFWKLAKLFVVFTVGLGGLFILFGFWLIPAIQLEMLASFFPQHLTIDSFGTAIWAGLLMALVNVVTHRFASSSSQK